MSGVLHLKRISMFPLIPDDEQLPLDAGDDAMAPTIRINNQEIRNASNVSIANTTNTSGYQPSEVSIALTGQSDTSTLLKTLDLSTMTRCQKIRVKTKHRAKACLTDLYMIQQLTCSTAVYCMQMSPDGVYLAAGCGDGSIRVWELFSQILQREKEMDPLVETPKTAAIFSSDPVQIFMGHEGEVISLSWSTNNFLLSASTDGTVRLWSPTRPDCLALFPHSDIVTSVAFHPQDNRRFVTGCFDCRVRLWGIEENKVLAWHEFPAENVVTAVAWSLDGMYALAGSSTGVLLYFITEGFKYYTQIFVKSTRGRNSTGKKIASILMRPPDKSSSSSKDQSILISSNDSRIRAYSLQDKSEHCKYLGHKNETSQIQASYSDDGSLIISGTEDGRCCVWAADQTKWSLLLSSKDKRCESYEYFSAAASDVPCACAIFAYEHTLIRLKDSELRPNDDVPHRFIITADTEGRIRVFENYSGLPKFLES